MFGAHYCHISTSRWSWQAEAGLGWWAASSRLTLESNYNDRRRNPSLGRESFLERRAGRRVAQRYAHAASHPTLTSGYTRKSASCFLFPHPVETLTLRNNPICKNPLFSRTAIGLYGGGDGGADSRPCLFQFLFVSELAEELIFVRLNPAGVRLFL